VTTNRRITLTIASVSDGPQATQGDSAKPEPPNGHPSPIAEVRWIAGRPVSWIVVIAAGVLSGVTAVVVARASALDPARQSRTDWPIADVMQLELLFGGVLVAVGFGLIGASRRSPADPTGGTGVRMRLVRMVLLLFALVPALVVIHAAAIITISVAPGSSIRAADGVAESTVLLLRGWLALLPFGAVGYALGATLRRPMSGLLGAVAILLVDGILGAVVSTRFDIWWSPIGNAAALVGATTGPDWTRAAVVSIAYVGFGLAVVGSINAARRPDPG
jgi:hypothetical protein